MDLNTLGYLLAGCFALGMLHGVLPDEHTWPITFAYSVGTATGRGGIRSGAFFSAAFTLQRAAMSELVYFAVAAFLVTREALNGPVYFVVGLAMAIAGYLILSGRVMHFHPLMRLSERDLKRHTAGGERHGAGKVPPGTPEGHVPAHWAVIHGFISGFGVDTGLFTVFVYLTAVPFLANYGLWEIGWLPGALFGLGTFLVLMLVGFVFGGTLQIAKRFGTYRIAQFGRVVGARVLLLGGIAFMVFGPLYFYGVGNWLSAHLGWDPGTFIVVLVLVAIAAPVMFFTWHEVRQLPRDGPEVEHGRRDHHHGEALEPGVPVGSEGSLPGRAPGGPGSA
ncbi:MAG: hypothetical protein KGJ23_15595 [Euryarchaeota archaeon]|nr:hypothetical protein [Euryarchaeota archaeon]MDE1838023.1 hypothetical protein [Euryarchaeota archaeon]MDE1880122.1 hypothetical protein [Euryarchaeota archaeon]MDE2045040.1 hypothetical protein [Thermoplasmata archaeon]